MIKITYMSKIYLNQSVNCLLTEEKKVGIKKLKNPKVLTEYSQSMDDVHENVEDYKSKGEC